VLTMSFFVFGLVSCGLTEAKQCLQCGITDCQSNNFTCYASFDAAIVRDKAYLEAHARYYKPETYDWMINFCCSCSLAGMPWFLEHMYIGGADLGGPLYSVLANCIFSLTCYQLMMCACMQHRSRRARNIAEVLGYVVLFAIACALWVPTSYLVHYVRQHNATGDALRNFVLGRFLTWMAVSFVNLAIFSVLWPIQRSSALGGNVSQVGPLEHKEADKRNLMCRLLAPRFNVNAAEFAEYVRSCGQEDHQLDERLLQSSTVHDEVHDKFLDHDKYCIDQS